MSQENVEIVRRLLDAWNRQDAEGILALTDPEAEYVNAPAAVEPGTRRGHDEIAVVLRKQWEALAGGVQEIDGDSRARADDRRLRRRSSRSAWPSRTSIPRSGRRDH